MLSEADKLIIALTLRHWGVHRIASGLNEQGHLLRGRSWRWGEVKARQREIADYFDPRAIR